MFFTFWLSLEAHPLSQTSFISLLKSILMAKSSCGRSVLLH